MSIVRAGIMSEEGEPFAQSGRDYFVFCKSGTLLVVGGDGEREQTYVVALPGCTPELLDAVGKWGSTDNDDGPNYYLEGESFAEMLDGEFADR